MPLFGIPYALVGGLWLIEEAFGGGHSFFMEWTLVILPAFILFASSVLALIFALAGRRQIKQTQQRGQVLSLATFLLLVVSYASLAGWLAVSLF